MHNFIYLEVWVIISTSAKDTMFCLCASMCQSVSRITQKIVNKFWWNFWEGWNMWLAINIQILVVMWIMIRTPSFLPLQESHSTNSAGNSRSCRRFLMKFFEGRDVSRAKKNIPLWCWYDTYHNSDPEFFKQSFYYGRIGWVGGFCIQLHK